MPRTKRVPRTAEEKLAARREYQRQYYRRNKEKAQAYQRQYNLTHKKKRTAMKDNRPMAPREVVVKVFTPSRLQALPAARFGETVNRILSGERSYTI